MATVNLNNNSEQIDTSLDSIVIVENFETIRGGRSLDVTGFTPTVIKAGHVIIKETATSEYKPMPISGSAYAALPSGHEYAGILVATILTAKPFAAIMVRGTVNHVAGPYTITSILSAVKTALPGVFFRAD